MSSPCSTEPPPAPVGLHRLASAAALALASFTGAACGQAPDEGPAGPVRPVEACLVSRVVDGDSVECDGGRRVRLIGMDTPERDQPPHGSRAAAQLARLIPTGTHVALEGDVETRDRYDRILAYVWLGDTLVNWVMVRQGWAVPLTIAPNVQYAGWFAAAGQRAREEGLGLWATGGFDCLPADHRRRAC